MNLIMNSFNVVLIIILFSLSTGAFYMVVCTIYYMQLMSFVDVCMNVVVEYVCMLCYN